MNAREKILVKRGYLLENLIELFIDSTKSRYYTAKLLVDFGVLVNNPLKVTDKHIEIISSFFGKTVPSGFYKNPQDTKYFSCGELLLEQLVSYMTIEHFTGVYSEDESSFDRVEIFKKALPNYEEGKEVTFRKYRIINKAESVEVLHGITKNLSSYTRKWGIEEEQEFNWLYDHGFYNEYKIESKDNAISMFLYTKGNISFAKYLDQKDVVKLSISMVGEQSNFTYDENEKMLLFTALKNCKSSSLTKKQAKYFNTISKKVMGKSANADNGRSPYKRAQYFMANKEPVEAAAELSRSGSLLERNLMWVLSRCDFKQAEQVLNLVEIKSPIVAIQLVNGLLKEDNGPRTFKYYKENLLNYYTETEEESKWRKSRLSEGMKRYIKDFFDKKIDQYYKELPKLGTIYIDRAFEKVALPLNTSASGSGLDVKPAGSRINITADYIRTFTYWHNAFDIDASVIFVKDKNIMDFFYWGNYNNKSRFGDSALCSGDDRSANGAEYIDFKISELRAMGYKYAIYTLNGFNSNLNSGEIFCGYQNKDDLDTEAWDPKNIAMKIHVKGDSRGYMGFAIDLETKEMIILNQLLNSDSRVVEPSMFNSIEHLLNSKYLKRFNIARILGLRGTKFVNNPLEADYVFMDNYDPKDFKGDEVKADQMVIKTSDIEKLVNLLNK